MTATLDTERFRAEYAKLKSQTAAFEEVAAVFGVDLSDDQAPAAKPVAKAKPKPATSKRPSSTQPKRQPATRATGASSGGRIRPAILDVLTKAKAPMHIQDVENALMDQGVVFGKNSIGSQLRNMAGVERVGHGVYALTSDLSDEPDAEPDDLVIPERFRGHEHLSTAYMQGYSAPAGTECVYEEGSQVASVWREGHDKAAMEA